MENKSTNGIKSVIFSCLVFLGILIGVVFISTTIFILLKFSSDFIVTKGLGLSILFSLILNALIKYKKTRNKNIFKFWLSFIIFFAGIIFTHYIDGGEITRLIDIPTFIITGIVPFLFAAILYGFKETVAAFSIQTIDELDKEKLKKTSRFFETYGNAVLISGAISVIIGIINILSNLDDNHALYPNLAVALISILYSCIIYILIIIPYSVFIKNKLNE